MAELNFMKIGDIQLGDIYRDCVTGFEGVATSATGYLASCVRVGLTPLKLTDKGLPEHEIPVFDAKQLIHVGAHAPLEAMKKQLLPLEERPGGPGRVNAMPAVPKR